MYKIYSLVAALFVASLSFCQSTVATAPRILYGSTTKDSLLQNPFADWFSANYTAYNINEKTVADFKKLNFKNTTIKIFFGTWCGDSKREVPRFLKLLNSISFPENQVQLIALGSDSLPKQSPQHEEACLGIFRVPTFVVYENGKETNRINEFPVTSLEKDLQTIFSKAGYQPNYKSFVWLKTWLADGTLLDENSSSHGLANQLRNLVADENELNSAAYLLLEQSRPKEALKLFQMNYYLYPASANIVSSLGEGYLKNGDTKNAVLYLEQALVLNKEPKLVKGILKLLYQAKEAK